MRILVIFHILFSYFWIADCLSCDKPDQAINSEVKLRKKLLCNGYDKHIRPGITSEKTEIGFRYTVKTFDYSESDRILTVTSWMTMRWKDDRLTWTASEFDGIALTHIHIDLIWTPDIYAYNSNIQTGLGTCHAVDCFVNYDGTVVCVMPCEHSAHCKSGEYVNWPFDRQNCTFTFGSWMKTGEELNYNTDKVKLITKRAKQNNKWKLISASSVYNIGKYASIPNETYPSLTFAYYIERHSAHHVVETIVPAIILITCNLTILWMIPGCIERFILGIVNLFSHFLYLEFLYWMLPFCGDSVPNVLVFFRDSQVIAALILIQTVVIKSLTTKTDRPNSIIQMIVTRATSNRYGELILTQTEPKIEDAADLVESVKKSSLDENIWLAFCKFIDRIFFFVFLVAYIFMFFALIPEGYWTEKFDSIGSEDD